MRLVALVGSVAGFLAFGLPALADDLQPSVDEASGHWVALTFSDGPAVKICATGSTDQRITFRSDETSLEFRSGNDSWSLSADASGDVTVKIGSVMKTVHMETLNATTLSGTIAEADLTDIMDAMDKAGSATLIFGSKAPVTVSLAGSTRALNSFRTCSAVHGFAHLGGSAGQANNPF